MAFLNFKNLRKNNQQLGWFLFDVMMISLAIFNINLILFDFLFSYDLAFDFFYSIVPKWTIWYDTYVHQHFILIDLGFVAIFFAEFFLRWMIAAYQKEYEKWWFFPFARWYDLLGLIPIGSFRFLRVLRVFSILTRLHKMQVINFRESSFYPFLHKYYHVFVEEVSDRVVINVLDGVKSELAEGDDMSHEIVHKVIKPNNEIIVNFALQKVQAITSQVLKNNQEAIREYLFTKVQNAVNENDEMQLIKAVPGIGSIIRKQLDNAIADVTYKVISGIVEDVANGEDVLSQNMADISSFAIDTLENDTELESIVQNISSDIIDIVKKQVEVKKWKEG
ncbi:MAG: hypothetical protein ACPG4Z_02440 [Chitinophagales bacterium]